MKRLSFGVALALLSLAMLGTPALAAQYPPSKTVSPTPPPPSVAFTGANVTVGLVILIGLVVLGAVLLVAGRRRRAGAVK